jgi:hypothetical protein
MQAIKVDQQGIQTVYIMVKPGQTDREAGLHCREQYSLVSFHTTSIWAVAFQSLTLSITRTC